MVMLIGGLNIFTGVLTTIQQFLKITESNEAHRVASISWDKFHRNIRVELCKSPPERTPVAQMLKISKEEFDRLMETSPVLSPQGTTSSTFLTGTASTGRTCWRRCRATHRLIDSPTSSRHCQTFWAYYNIRYG